MKRVNILLTTETFVRYYYRRHRKNRIDDDTDTDLSLF